MAMIPTFWPPVVPDAMAWMDAPPRERMATALPPGVPSRPPSIDRPELSGRTGGRRPADPELDRLGDLQRRDAAEAPDPHDPGRAPEEVKRRRFRLPLRWP